MKDTDNIEKVVQDFCAVRKSTVKTTTEMDRKIINDALAAQEKSKKQHRPNSSRIYGERL